MEHRNSVLIVEDDVNINGLLKEALEKEGYICTQAFSGTEARMILQGERYSVILLDLMLPGIPGEEVLRDIRKKGNFMKRSDSRLNDPGDHSNSKRYD